MSRFFGTVFLIFSLMVQSQDTLTIMHYNLLMFGNNTGDCNQSTNNYVTKTGYLKTIVDYVKPDILTVNEINESYLYHDYILNYALNVNGIDYYERANPPNHSNSYIINQIFYNADKLTLNSNVAIETNYRDIDIFKLKVNDPGTPNEVDLNCCVAHLKAGNSEEEATERANETSKLMNYLNNSGAAGNYTMSGDFNLYTASEQAFQNLLFHSNVNIRFYDPVNMIGSWNNNEFYAAVHTQSTHTNGDCFSTGGLDDRFDFILASDEIINGTDYMKLVQGSYKALGQDGQHFNDRLNGSPQNNSVPEDVLNALYNMSDHLPIVMKVIVGENLGLQNIREKDFTITLQNPVKNDIYLSVFTRQRKDLTFRISNLQGKIVFAAKTSIEGSNPSYKIPFENIPAGLYLMTVGDGTDQVSTLRIIKQ